MLAYRCVVGYGLSTDPQRAALKNCQRAIDHVISDPLPYFQQLPAFAAAFTSTPGNGFAQCHQEHGQFVDFFLILDQSVQIAMNASMRVVSIDGAHLPHHRRDLRLLVLEGITGNNTIFSIAFMICSCGFQDRM